MGKLRLAAKEGWRGIMLAAFGYRDNPVAKPVRRRLWGPRPGIMLALVALTCCVLGALVERSYGTKFFLLDGISWPVVVFSLLVAVRMRSVLRSSKELLAGARGDDGFAAFAIPLFPAALLLVLVAPVSRVAVGLPPLSFDPGDLTGPVALVALIADSLRGALGLGAALAVVSATLCYRKDWMSAMLDLIIRAFIFGIMISITLMVLGFMGPIIAMVLGTLVRALTPWTVPVWFSELVEALTDDGALVLVHLALIGGAWIAAREGFATLLSKGDVDLMAILSKEIEGEDEDDENPVGGLPVAVVVIDVGDDEEEKS